MASAKLPRPLGPCEHKPCGEGADAVLGAHKRALCANHAIEALLALPEVRAGFTDLELAAGKVSLSKRYAAVVVVGVEPCGDVRHGAWKAEGGPLGDPAWLDVGAAVVDVGEALKTDPEAP